MGKKRHSTGYTSKGERRNVSKATTKAVRREYLQNGNVLFNKFDAWKKGKNVMVTMPNPNKNETNKRFIRVKASHVWGNPNYVKKKSA
tara:strand:- start:204 stop:467 length:264 start_codon:yes stop_codon:yes gene_type:complete